MSMYVAVIGADGAGKSHVARALGRGLGLGVVESGALLTAKLARMLAEIGPRPGYAPPFYSRVLTQNKNALRPLLSGFGDRLSRVSPERLVRDCLRSESGCVVVGLRRLCERDTFQRLVRQFGGRPVWVRVRRPAVEAGRTFELSGSPCEFVIHNDGSKAELQRQVRLLIHVLQSRRQQAA